MSDEGSDAPRATPPGAAERLGERKLYSGKVVDLRVETVRLPNGRIAEIEIVHHPGAAAVVPLTADREVVLLRQYRHATGRWLFEVPAGKLDAGEDPAVCARRELAEETGLAAQELTPLGVVWTTPGFSDERIWLYLARGLGASTQALEEDEVLEVVRLPLAEAVRRAADGEIEDAKSTCALLRAAAVLNRAR